MNYSIFKNDIESEYKYIDQKRKNEIIGEINDQIEKEKAKYYFYLNRTKNFKGDDKTEKLNYNNEHKNNCYLTEEKVKKVINGTEYVKEINTIKSKQKKLNKSNTENNNKKTSVTKKSNKIDIIKSSNRLYKIHQQILTKKQKTKKIIEENELKKCTFNPILNQTNKVFTNDIYTRGIKYIKDKTKKIEDLRNELNKLNDLEFTGRPEIIKNFNFKIKKLNGKNKNNYEEEKMRECTFTPKLNNNDNFIKNDYNFYQRMKIFSDIKKNKIQKIKKNMQIFENVQCTFKPTINSISKIIAYDLHNNEKDDYA